MDTIYEKAVKKWSIESQIDQAMEECAELIVALNHWKRGRDGGKHEVCGEIADVKIMLRQLEVIFGKDEILNAESEKINRFIKRLEA